MGRVTLDPSGVPHQMQADPAMQELETAFLRKEVIKGHFIDLKKRFGWSREKRFVM